MGHTILLLTKRPDLLDVNVVWPSNVHLGVSVTSNADAGRIATLLEKGRAMREQVGASGPGVLWASVEPLLDPNFDALNLVGLDWVVVGAQTGVDAAKPGSQEANFRVRAAAWIVEWCRANKVPCFVKDNLCRQAGGRGAWPREFPA
jgi:protein gp37